MLKNIVLIIVAFYFNIISFSQEIITEADLPKSKKIQFGFNFSADVCYRTLTTNDTGVVAQYIIESRNGYEVLKLGYSVGANIYYNHSRHFAFETGLRYSNCGFGTGLIDITYFSADPNIPDFFRTIDGFHYAEVPLKLIVKSGDKKINFFLHASIIPAILTITTSRSKSTYPDGHKENDIQKSSDDFKHFNLFSSAGIGMAYHLKNESQIRFEPTFKFGLLSIIDAPIDGYLWNTGLNISYYF